MNVLHKTLQRYDNIAYHLGHISQLDLPESAFDVVVVHFVLHEVPPGERPAGIIALGHKLKPGGRLILREPQGEGLALEEISRLTTAAGLRPTLLKASNIATGAIYDACFVR